MAKLNCRCGWQISNVCEPSEEIMYLLTGKAWDDLCGALDSDEIPVVPEYEDLWKCSKCGRIAIGNDKVTWYRPEEEINANSTSL